MSTQTQTPFLPELITNVATYLFPSIKDTLRLALTCTTNFSTIATNANIWRSLYIENESFTSYSDDHIHVKDSIRLKQILSDPKYTDQKRKIGKGRTARSVWFRCAMMMAMRRRAHMEWVTGFIDRDRLKEQSSDEESSKDGSVDEAEDVNNGDAIVVEDGMWDGDIIVFSKKTVREMGLKITYEHGFAYPGECRPNLIAAFLNAPTYDYPDLSETIKFGDCVISADDEDRPGHYFVTLSSAVGQGHEVSYALIEAKPGHAEQAGLPETFAPPTFPFSYYEKGFCGGWLTTSYLKNGVDVDWGPDWVLHLEDEDWMSKIMSSRK